MVCYRFKRKSVREDVIPPPKGFPAKHLNQTGLYKILNLGEEFDD